MKRTFAFIAVAAMLAILFVPMIVPSTDAVDEPTTISAYFYNDSKDISTSTNITIKVIYHEDGAIEPATVIGETSVISEKDTLGNNKFTVQIEPGTTMVKTDYYFYFNIDGFSVKSTPHAVSSEVKELNVTEGSGTASRNCYQITETGNITEHSENIIGGTGDVFTMKSALGIVKGTVTMNTAEPTYLNGVKVTLFNLETEKELAYTYTSYHGSYSIEYNTGTYGIKFEINGYDNVSKEVTIGDGTQTDSDAVMKQNASYFGLDLPHVLMILGGAAAIVLLLFATFMRLRVSKR